MDDYQLIKEKAEALGSFGTLKSQTFSNNFREWILLTRTTKSMFAYYIFEALKGDNPDVYMEIDDEYLSLVVNGTPINWATTLFISKMENRNAGHYNSDAPDAQWIPNPDPTELLIENFKDYAFHFIMENLEGAEIHNSDMMQKRTITVEWKSTAKPETGWI